MASTTQARITRSLLGYGMIVGPIYLITGIAQGVVRDGFSFQRHPLSVLANGPGGWVQTTNFIVCGLMVIAAAVGIMRVIRPQSRATSWFLGMFGMGMLLGAIFRADPMDGFPVGTPLGMPTTISMAGGLHFLAGTLGFVSLGISCILASRAMKRRNEPGLAQFSLIAGIVVILGFFGPMFIPGVGGVAGIWLSVVMGWTWLAILSKHLYRVSPDPNC
jgi:hypothetical membrane protein